MSSSKLKSLSNLKVEANNIFNEKFLKEKDLALEPISLLFESESSLNDCNITEKNSLLLDLNIERSKTNNIKESALFNSNIIIVQPDSDEEREPSSFEILSKEIDKINRLISLRKSKRKRKYSSNSKKKSSESMK